MEYGSDADNRHPTLETERDRAPSQRKQTKRNECFYHIIQKERTEEANRVEKSSWCGGGS